MNNLNEQPDLNHPQAKKQLTGRPVVEALEEILGTSLQVLDHGFVRVVDYMGDDSSIVQAARVSYGRGTKTVNVDRGLINYLMRHSHTTPFEMCEIKLHVKLPIFVARHWIRHRTASVNEYSARYSILDKEFYVPQPEVLGTQSKTNMQGRDEVLDPQKAAWVLKILKQDAEQCYSHYLQMMNLTEDEEHALLEPKESGLSRELARINLPVNFYTQWYWKVNLHNLLHFLRLRADAHAQYEIREYARVILEIVKKWVPMAYDAFMNYKVNSVGLSAAAWKVVQKMLQGQHISFEDSSLSRREWEDLQKLLERS